MHVHYGEGETFKSMPFHTHFTRTGRILAEPNSIGRDEVNVKICMRIPHATIQLTKWQPIQATVKVKRSKAPTTLYHNFVSTFHPLIKLIHDIELNPGIHNFSAKEPGNKNSNSVKIAHLNA